MGCMGFPAIESVASGGTVLDDLELRSIRLSFCAGALSEVFPVPVGAVCVGAVFS